MPVIAGQLRIEDIRRIEVKVGYDDKEGGLLAVLTVRTHMEPEQISELLTYVKRSSFSAIQVESRQMTLPMKKDGAEQPPLPDGQDADAPLTDEQVDAAVAADLADATLSLVRTMGQPALDEAEDDEGDWADPNVGAAMAHSRKRPPKKHVDTDTGEITEEVA